MNVEITGRHVVITPAIRAYVLKKLGKLTKIFGDDINFHVIIEVEKERQTAEILLKSKMLQLTGKGQSEDLYNSIMRAIEKLERQALKHKGKLIEGKRKKAKPQSIASKIEIEKPASGVLDRKLSVMREELVHKKPMDVEEAVLELDQSGYAFVVFRNAESGDVNVLYRRKDGILGLIRS
jgi:putative sigma-54 modulation protein